MLIEHNEGRTKGDNDFGFRAFIFPRLENNMIDQDRREAFQRNRLENNHDSCTNTRQRGRDV